MKHPVFCLLALCLLAACSQKVEQVESKPEWVLEEDKMVAILVDLRITDAATYNNSGMPPRDKAKDWHFVMKKHGVVDSIFRQSNDYYALHPGVTERLYEKVIDRISEMQAENSNGQ